MTVGGDTRSALADPREERAAVLIARAWLEDRPDARLRVRITFTHDIRSAEREMTVVSTVDDACAAVRCWLESLLLP